MWSEVRVLALRLCVGLSARKVSVGKSRRHTMQVNDEMCYRHDH